MDQSEKGNMFPQRNGGDFGVCLKAREDVALESAGILHGLVKATRSEHSE